MTPTLVVTLKADAARRAVIESTIGSAARVIYLADVLPNERAMVLAQASVLLAYNTAEDLRPGEAALLGSVRLIQFITAGIDYIPLADLPVGVPLASNGGAYAEPMAEHALAMALAALKRLFVEHAETRSGHIRPIPRQPHAGRLSVRHSRVWRHRDRNGTPDVSA